MIEDPTYRFLLEISKHLSPYSTWSSEELRVKISKTGKVEEYPKQSLYPSIHNRKLVDKEDILEHVLRRHNGWIFEHGLTLTPGVYLYKFNIFRTKRKWIKLY